MENLEKLDETMDVNEMMDWNERELKARLTPNIFKENQDYIDQRLSEMEVFEPHPVVGAS